MLGNIVLRLNTFMRTQRRKHDQEYGNFFANYIGQRSAYIEIDLNLNHLPLRQREEQAAKIARKFRNNLSRFYYGNAARKQKKFAAVVIHLHKTKKTETGAFWHLHIIAAVPDDMRFQAVRDFSNDFVVRNFPQVKPRAKDICFFEPTRDAVGAAIYDGKFGPNSISVF